LLPCRHICQAWRHAKLTHGSVPGHHVFLERNNVKEQSHG
jgi:hypothetical protein